MLPHPLAALLAAALFAAPLYALSIPTTATVLAPACSPRLSGLSQHISPTGKAQLALKSASSASGGGVKLATLPKGPDASFEFIVEREGSTYSASSASSAITCSPTSLQQPLQPSCNTSHSFQILCQECDDHDDAASGCQLRLDPVSSSKNAGLCIELSEGTAAKLRWGACVRGNKKGEVKGASKERQLASQLFNIA